MQIAVIEDANKRTLRVLVDKRGCHREFTVAVPTAGQHVDLQAADLRGLDVKAVAQVKALLEEPREVVARARGKVGRLVNEETAVQLTSGALHLGMASFVCLSRPRLPG